MPKFLHKNEWGCELNQCCNSTTQSYGHVTWYLPTRDERRPAVGLWGVRPCSQERTKGKDGFCLPLEMSLDVLLGTATAHLLSAWACRHHWERQRKRDARNLVPWRHCWVFDSTNPGGCLPLYFLLCEMTSFIIFLAYLSWDICYCG